MFSVRLAATPQSIFRCFATTAKTPAAASKKSPKFQSGYSLFTQDNYSKVQQSEGHLNFAQTSKAIASKWSALTDAQRAAYNDKAKENNSTNQVTKSTGGRPRKNEDGSDASGAEKKTKRTKKSKKTVTTTNADGTTTESEAPKKRSAYQNFLAESYATLRDEAARSGKAAPALTDAVKQLSPVWSKLPDEEKSAFGELPKKRTTAGTGEKRGRPKGSTNKKTDGRTTEGKQTDGRTKEGREAKEHEAHETDARHTKDGKLDGRTKEGREAKEHEADARHTKDGKLDGRTKEAKEHSEAKHTDGRKSENKKADHE